MSAANGHARVAGKLRRLRVRYERATASLTALEQERAALYQEARDLDPPMTFREIATIFGITEAAVMQKSKRAERAAAK